MHFCCRAPYGARGLKFLYDVAIHHITSRAPYGARGLKFEVFSHLVPCTGSRPVWGAWIEIQNLCGGTEHTHVAPRMGRVD